MPARRRRRVGLPVVRADDETLSKRMGAGEVSGYRSEKCWAEQRHLPDVCPMRRTCEAVGMERDALRVANAGKDATIEMLERSLSEAYDEVQLSSREIDRLREKSETDDREIATLHRLVESLSERVAGQAEILTQRAERSKADDLRDGEGEG